MSRRSIEKGKRAEREIVSLLNDNGIKSQRVPLSGSTDFQRGDVVFELFGDRYVGEVKRRKRAFKLFYGSLEHSDMVFFRDDTKDWLVAMPFGVFLRIIKYRR